MIVGTGVDIVDVRRIGKSIDRFGERFVNKILAEPEYSDLEGAELVSYLAKQFAAKEAVSKALGTGMGGGVHFHNILVLRGKYGAPFVELVDGAAKRAGRLGVTNLSISLSDEKDYAVAFVVAT